MTSIEHTAYPRLKRTLTSNDPAPETGVQETLFDTDHKKRRDVADAVDRMNDRYGEYVITPALMMGLETEIIDRIAFGSVQELEEMYAR